MISDAEATIQEVTRFLSAADRDLLNRLLDDSVEVVIFGSRASCVHSRLSDLDIFCVGACQRYKSERLDIVSRTSSQVGELKWLGSELAGHVATYGIVIRGRTDWKSAVRVSDAAVAHKERRVISLVNGLWTYWDRIHFEFRRKHLVTIRREVQRLQLLREGVGVPPTPILDSRWKNGHWTSEAWVRSVKNIKTKDGGSLDRLLRTTDLIVSQNS